MSKTELICEEKFYEALEDELMNVNVFLDMADEEERKECPFTETELIDYMSLLNTLMRFIDRHEKKGS